MAVHAMSAEGMTRPWLPGLLARLNEIAALEEDWDSYHAPPVTEAAVAGARSLIQAVSAWHTVNPKVRPQLLPTTEGGIDVVWCEQGYKLDLTVESDGRISGWLYRVSDDAVVTW
jgi:hypothetical protein